MNSHKFDMNNVDYKHSFVCKGNNKITLTFNERLPISRILWQINGVYLY